MPYITDSFLFEKITQPPQLSILSSDMRVIEWSDFPLPGFWQYVVELAKLSSDDTIYFWDCERSQGDAFRNSFGKFPAIELSTSMTEKEYLRELDEIIRIADGNFFLMNITESYCIAPASGTWRIFGDRDGERGQIISAIGLPPDNHYPHDFIK